MLEVEADRDRATENRAWACYVAAQKGHLEVVRSLLKLEPTKIWVNGFDGRSLEGPKGHLKLAAWCSKLEPTEVRYSMVAAQNGNFEVMGPCAEKHFGTSNGRWPGRLIYIYIYTNSGFEVL